jgi:hypothetical protein
MKIEMLNKAKDIIQTVNLLRCGNILQQLIDEVEAKPKSNAKPAFASSVFECPARDGDGALVVGLIVYSYKNGENHCEMSHADCANLKERNEAMESIKVLNRKVESTMHLPDPTKGPDGEYGWRHGFGN